MSVTRPSFIRRPLPGWNARSMRFTLRKQIGPKDRSQNDGQIECRGCEPQQSTRCDPTGRVGKNRTRMLRVVNEIGLMEGIKPAETGPNAVDANGWNSCQEHAEPDQATD